MSYQIEFSRRAEKELTRLPQQDQKRISEKIDALAQEPRPLGVKKLQGREQDANPCSSWNVSDFVRNSRSRTDCIGYQNWSSARSLSWVESRLKVAFLSKIAITSKLIF